MKYFTITKEELGKRLSSFGWRLTMMIAATIVAFMLDNLEVLNLAPGVIAVLGLVLGEVSKQINNNLKNENLSAAQK